MKTSRSQLRPVGAVSPPSAGGASANGRPTGWLLSSRRSIVVRAGDGKTCDRRVQALMATLEKLGIESDYIGRQDNPRHIASIAAERGADAIEICLSGGGVPLLRQLLRELIAIGRRDVSIVVHREDLID